MGSEGKLWTVRVCDNCGGVDVYGAEWCGECDHEMQETEIARASEIERLRRALREASEELDRLGSQVAASQAHRAALHPAGDPSDSRGGERSSPADEEQG
jgi:hypothetical protein